VPTSCLISDRGPAVPALGASAAAARPATSRHLNRRGRGSHGFALLVDETGVGERAAVTNVEPNMAGFDPIDDARELNRVASDAGEDHGRVAQGNSRRERWLTRAHRRAW